MKNRLLSTPAIISIVAYILVMAFSTSTLTIVGRMTGEPFNPFTYILNILILVPTVEFTIKAWHKYYHEDEYQMTMVSKVLTVMTFFAPFLAYGFTAYVLRALLRKEHIQFDAYELASLIVTSVLSVGIVWLFVGTYKYVLKVSLGDIFPFEGYLNNFDRVMLVVLTIVTAGIFWLLLWMSIAGTEYIFKTAWNQATKQFVPISRRSNTIVIVASILTAGIFALGLFISYGILELSLVYYKNTIQKEIEVSL